MEADHGVEVHPGARHVQDNPAAEAVADRGDLLWVDGFLACEEFFAREEPGLRRLHVLEDLRGELSRRHRGARPVCRRRTCRPRAPCIPSSASILARLRAYSLCPHHSWTTRTPGRFPGFRGVVSEIALERRFARRVCHFLATDVRLRGGGGTPCGGTRPAGSGRRPRTARPVFPSCLISPSSISSACRCGEWGGTYPVQCIIREKNVKAIAPLETRADFSYTVPWHRRHDNRSSARRAVRCWTISASRLRQRTSTPFARRPSCATSKDDTSAAYAPSSTLPTTPTPRSRGIPMPHVTPTAIKRCGLRIMSRIARQGDPSEGGRVDGGGTETGSGPTI